MAPYYHVQRLYPTGRYRFQFGKKSQNFYWSGPVDDSGSIVLRGVVNVQDKASFAGNISLTIGKHEAIYAKSSGRINLIYILLG